MRKFLASLLLLVTMLPFAAKAEELTVYDGTVTSQYVPMYVYYFDEFTRSQFVIPAADLEDMTNSAINSIKFYTNLASDYTTESSVDVYLKEVDYTSISSYEDKASATIVYSGFVSFTADKQVVITFTEPFTYFGGNLLIGIENTTNVNYKNISFYGTTVNGASIAGSNSSSLANVPATQRNYIPKTTFFYEEVSVTGTNITTNPATLDLGYRANNAWMPAYQFEFYNDGLPATITGIEANAPFVAAAELPANIGFEGTVPAEISTIETTATGATTGEFLLMYNGAKDFMTFNVSANFYNAATPDVWEKAQEVTSIPYTGTAPATIYKNYNIPGAAEDAKDAVYKVTLTEDAMLTATTNKDDGVTAIYPEDFQGLGGPDMENYYEYEGLDINPGPTVMWFSYEYTGSNTWYGLSAGGGYFFGYKISADIIAANNLANLSLVTVESAARESYPYDLYILRGGETPDDAELIYYNLMETNPAAQSFFDVNIDEPFVIGEENLWVIFYSDSPYAAYCGRYPSDTENGKIWTMNPNATTPAWTSSTNYTPVIYCHLMELPTGRQITMNLANMSMEGRGNGIYSEEGEAEGNVLGVSHAQNYMAAKAQSNRTATSLSEGLYVTAGTYYVVAAATETPFTVSLTTAPVPAPEPAVINYPADGETGVTAPLLIEWTLGNYTEEMQVLFGTQYPPTDVLIDWTDELVESAIVTSLENNMTYFIMVNERNAGGETSSEVSGFTTPIDPVQGFAVVNDQLYPGDAAEFTWEANRALQGYNIYKDGVKVNEAPITETEYAVEGLEYNMTGYNFQIAAQYKEGESALSAPVLVKMTGNGSVSGTVYEQDETTVIPGITIEYRGTDEYGADQSFTFTSDENGQYSGEVLAGTYQTYAYSDAYQESPGPEVTVAYGDELTNIDIIVYEFYFPLGQIHATEQTDENNVLVEWDWTPGELVVDFETGDFSQADFILPATYPWAVTTTNPHEGTYCMKSTCEGIASGLSEIEVTVDVPFEAAKMGFWVRTSTEANWDKFHFYIDGVEQGNELSGNNPYAYKEFAVTSGTHTYKWAYQKDSSVNSNDDCVYVDDIVMYRQDVPAPPVVGGQDYNFDDGTMMGWTSLDADGDGNGWVSSSNPGIYHNAGVSLAGTGHNASEAYVISGSYANQTGQALSPDNYLVSPQISAQNGAQIRFYACAQDASYAAEHFGVAVSTTTATSGAFTTIEEWTMTAKSARDVEKVVRGNRQGTWYEYTVDLSAYAGQDIYVAIRHFNCTDMFILNVDDITLATGGSKVITRNDRTFQSFNLYRRDVKNGEEDAELVLIAQPGADVFEYVDNAWASLPYGAYQWGIQATYDGNAPRGNRDVLFTDDFESGLTDWTLIDNGTPTGHGWGYTDITLLDWEDVSAHSGVGVASSWSWSNSAFDQDSYMISPLVEGATSVNYFVATNTAYPDYYEIMASSTGTNASDFTVVFSETAPTGSKNGNAKKYAIDGTYGSNDRAFSPWTERTIELPAGTKYVAFHHEDYDANYLFIDDVTISGGGDVPPAPPVPTGEGLSDILWSNTIDKDMYATVTVNVSLNNGQSPAGVALAMVGAEANLTATIDATGVVVFENVRKGDYEVTATMADFADYNATVTISETEQVVNIVLMELVGPVSDLYVSPTGWAMWSGATSGTTPTPPPTPPTGGQWYQYDSGEFGTSVGLGESGGQFYFGVMFPAGTYQGNTVTKVSKYDATGQPMTGSVTIYNDGTSAPETPVGTANCSFSGTEEDFVEVVFTNPVTIDPSKNLWVIFDNASGDPYPAACSPDVTGDPNGRWIGLSGAWYDMAAVGVAGYTNMVRAYVSNGAKGEVHEISVPTKDYKFGTLKTAPAKGTRAALSFKVMLDGAYEGETRTGYFQHNVEGFEEGSVHTTSVAAIYATGMGEWVDYTWTYTPCDNFNGASNVTAAQSENVVNISWEMPDAPTPPAPPTGGWQVGFEEGMPEGWTVLDANNDGTTWCLTSDIPSTWTYYASLTLDWYRTGTNAICSGSYINGIGAITPNEYLITSQVTPAAGSTFSFWAAATDASYPADHFGVAVSTTGTSASDFTILSEWTLTAKGNGIPGGVSSREGKGEKLGTWHQYSVDLSSYAGQPIYIAIRHFNCNDQYIMCVDDIELGTNTKAVAGNRDPWDLVKSFNAAEGAQYGVASDGEFIYTCNWGYSSATHNFYKYDLDGNVIEGFEIPGCGTIRDLTYDGEYFYGGANASTLYCIDMNTKTLVSSTPTTCSGIRHCSYDPVNDGFWVGGWSDLKLIDRTGATIQNGPAVESVSGTGYYTAEDGSAHLYLFTQAASDAKVYDFNIATNTVGSMLFDFSATPGYDSGSSGGAFIGSYNGKTCFFGDAQQSPNLIGIYELDENGAPGPGPGPTPGEYGILGAYVFRNGELISGTTPLTTTTFVDADAPAGDNEYCVRVVYDGALDTTFYAMSCPVCAEVEYECIPVNNLTAEYTYNSAEDYGVTLAWECEQADDVLYYNIFYSDTIVTGVTALEYYVEMTDNPGEYTFSVTAVYPNCESEPVYATVNVTSVNDINGKVVLYPNPTNSTVNIEAAGMKHITVVNALGQVVYDTDINADMIQLNLGQYKPGVYMVRINTEEGVSVKRVTVVK